MVNTALEETLVGERSVVVRAGDVVRVLPSRPYKRDGFDATVRAIVQLDDGQVEVTVVGAPVGRPKAHRTFRPDRLRAAKAARA